MTVGRLGERGVIDRIARRVTAVAHGVRLERGIGDDAAVASFRGDPHLVFTSDLLVEGTHFRSEWMPPHCLGHKVLAASLSDLAAMGATPQLFLLDLALPEHWPVDHLDGLAEGLARLADRHGILLAGGDTVASSRLHVGVTAIGRVEPGAALGRDGGRPGDGLVVSGPLGAAAAGLTLLEAGWRYEGDSASPPAEGALARVPVAEATAALEAHLLPEPDLAIGHGLVGRASAVIDLSDGLAQDLHRLCESSGCGAVVDLEDIPVASPARAVFELLGRDVGREALRGGEDYRLLAAVPAAGEVAAGLQPIGHLSAAADGLVLVTPAGRQELKPEGFEHFPAA